MSRFARGRGNTGEGGQSLVEFALVFPIFIVMLFGLIDGARFVYSDSVLSQAAREGARLAAVEAGWIGKTSTGCGSAGGPVCPASVAVLEQDIRVAVNRMVVGLATLSTVHIRCDNAGNEPTGAWTGVSCTNRDIGDVVSIRVQFTYQPLTPVVGSLLGAVARTASASMVIN